MLDATARHDYPGIIDRTYPGVVAAYGGRAEAIRKISTAMGQLRDQQKKDGIPEIVATIGEPGEFHTEGTKTFVVVATNHVARLKGGTFRHKAYLLGISSDGGKVWTFIDAGGFQDPKFREQVLPKLPENMKLPELGKGEFILDK